MIELHTLTLNPKPPFRVIAKPVVDNAVLDNKHLWKLRFVPVNPGEAHCFEVYVDNRDKQRVRAADEELFKQAYKFIKAFHPFLQWVETNILKKEDGK